MDDAVGVLELGAGEERRVTRDVGEQQIATSDPIIGRHEATIPGYRYGDSNPGFRTENPAS